MDLNYLLHRQQVERSYADAARSDQARRAHLTLACEYERRIERLSRGRIRFDHETERCAPAPAATV